MQITLGPEDSRFSKPNSLFSAEEIIGRKRAADPDNVAWLRAEAESEIIEKHPAAAITMLEKALELQPESAPLMLDLSIAIDQQAQSSGDRQGYAKAIDLLTKVIKSDPGDKEALFNLALTYSRLEMWDQAVTTWNAYLGLDPKGAWAEEAKQQLQLAASKSKSRSQSLPGALITAGAFLALSDSEIEFNSEHYQTVALEGWLSRAISEPGSLEYRAVSRLATAIHKEHSDPWLDDFLRSPTTRDALGPPALSAAVKANAKGHYLEAIKYSSQAERSFKALHNLPGLLRARYESVYASQRFLKGRDCADQAGPLKREAATRSYRWLQAQLAIESAICLNFIGNIRESDSELSTGLNLAQRSHFPVLALRDVGMAQSFEIQRGQFDLAWEEGLRGLDAYWRVPGSVQRIYQFYVGLALTAEHKGFWSAAAALQSHAVDILGEDDLIQRGAALLELGKIFAAEKRDDAAERVMREANILFDRESQEPTSRSYRLVGRIGLAELQARNGRTQEALETLSPVKTLLVETDPYFVSLNYYRTLGNIQIKLKRFDKAEQAYRTAILIAEGSLGRLESEHDRLQWIQASSDAYRGMVRTLLELHRDEDAFRLWEWYESRPSADDAELASVGKRQGPPTWGQLWNDISKISWSRHGLNRVVFVVYDDGLQIWTANEGKLRSVWVAIPREHLERTAKHFAQDCAQRDSSLEGVQRQGQELFRLLLQPILSDISPGAVVAAELDHPLSGLPLEALRSPDGWYFAEKYSVIYSPGVLGERRLRHPTPIDSNAVVLLVDSAGYLPGQELERETISFRFPRTRVLAPGTNWATLQTLLARSDIFGFMGHGEPNGSGTALRINSGLLLKAEVISPRCLRRIQLAVLAACDTGSSSSENGLIDNRNLIHALLAGGVPAVVASSWDVDSETTGTLMAAFYARMAERIGVVQALSLARRECRNGREHPYFWSAFRLYGETN